MMVAYTLNIIYYTLLEFTIILVGTYHYIIRLIFDPTKVKYFKLLKISAKEHKYEQKKKVQCILKLCYWMDTKLYLMNLTYMLYNLLFDTLLILTCAIF